MLALVLSLPETQHWHYLRLLRHAPAHAAGPSLPIVVEEAAGGVPVPRMHAPWTPLLYLVECVLAPHVCLAACLFGTMFVSFTQFPLLLAAPPFGFSASAVGACYLPIGVFMMAGSLLGGRISDAAGARHPGRPSARLVPSLLGAGCMPVGSLVFGWGAWAAQSYANPALLALVLVGHVLIGIGQSSYGPGFFAFVSQTKQANAAGAAGAALAVSFAIAAAFISAAVPVQAVIGTGGLFTVLAAVNAAALGWSALDLLLRRRSAALAADAGAVTAATEAVIEPRQKVGGTEMANPLPMGDLAAEAVPADRTEAISISLSLANSVKLADDSEVGSAVAADRPTRAAADSVTVSSPVIGVTVTPLEVVI